MKNYEKLDFNASMFKKLREKLNKMLQALTNIALETEKDSEITLKINIDTRRLYSPEEDKEIIEPNFDFKLTSKIKEAKDEEKGYLGINYALAQSEDKELYVKELNKQIEIGEEN